MIRLASIEFLSIRGLATQVILADAILRFAVMNTAWTFLEPWHVALRACIFRGEPTSSEGGMLVSFEWASKCHPYHQLSLVLHLEERNPQNVSQLNQIQEAIELFSVLSIVDNKAFTEHFSHLRQSMGESGRNWYPKWRLYVSGSATVQNDVWSRLLEFSDSPSQFQRAMQILKTMDEKGKEDIFCCTDITWDCKFDGGEAEASLEFDESDGIKRDLRRLFNVSASMMMQLIIVPDNTTSTSIWQHQHGPPRVNVVISIRDLTSIFCRDLAAGLVYTPIDSLHINLIEEDTTSSNPQATINAGVLLDRVYRWSRLISIDVSISCYKLSESVLAAICSTIAVQPTTTPFRFRIQPMSPDMSPWSRLVYAVCCSPSAEMSMSVCHTTLTKVDPLSVAETLAHSYPVLTSSGRPGAYETSEFGYVDIAGGTTVWAIDLEEGTTFVVPNSTRCRAWFKEDYVEVVVPGFGRCRSRIGDGVCEVSRDLEEQAPQVPSALRSLSVLFTSIESVSLVMSLLKEVGQNLHSLNLTMMIYQDELTIDLSVLSGMCPNLQSLEIRDLNVAVSDHNEALQVWPIVVNCGFPPWFHLQLEPELGQPTQMRPRLSC